MFQGSWGKSRKRKDAPLGNIAAWALFFTFEVQAMNGASDGSPNPAKAAHSRVATRVSSEVSTKHPWGCLSFPTLHCVHSVRWIMNRYQAMLVPHCTSAAVHQTKSSDSKRAILRGNTDRNYALWDLVWPPNQHKTENNLRKFQIILLCVISTVKTIFMREWWHVKNPTLLRT